jgi:hypothetical protein
VTWDEEGNFKLPRVNIHEHTRPRFWYIVAANCKMIDSVSFEVSFQNTVASPWNREFGLNEQGLNAVYSVFFLAYLIGGLTHAYGYFSSEEELGPVSQEKQGKNHLFTPIY